MVTVAEVNEVIEREKLMVASMAWSKKPNRETNEWREFFSALEFADDPTQTPEQLYIRCAWRQQIGYVPEVWQFALWYQGFRVFAIDFQPMSRHKNSKGKGRPFHGQVIQGTHIHTWSDDGPGYAEPLNLLSHPEGSEAWSKFVNGAGIINSKFVHPDKDIDAGQQVLRFES